MLEIENEINSASQLKKGDIINIFYFGQIIKSCCLVVELIQDHCFEKGLIIYLNGTNRETIDLENQNIYLIKKIN